MKKGDEVFAIIRTTSGAKLKFRFPMAAEPETVGARLEKALNASSLAIEIEGALMIFPVANIQSVQITPAPEHLPSTVIKGAHMVE